MPAAARIGDLHNCPMSTGPTPHVGGPILPGGEPTVLIGGVPAARAGDLATCTGPPDAIVMGSSTVLIGGMPAARQGDTTAHGGVIALGLPTVMIGDGTGSGGGGAAPAQSQDEAGEGPHFLEFRLWGEADRPIAGENYSLELPDGTIRRGQLDIEGKARIEGIEESGTCRLRFPRRDATMWGPDVEAAAFGQGEDVAEDDEIQAVTEGDQADGTWHEVQRGEDVFTIAADAGREWSALWDHPANQELRRLRGRPNLLFAGDRVFVPDREDRVEEIACDQSHDFRLCESLVPLRMQLRANGRILRNQPYRLFLGGEVITGNLDDEGRLDTRVPAEARSARLVVGRGLASRRYQIALGGLEPINSVRGIQQRLANLGYRCGVTGDLDEPTKRALRCFQRRQDLRVKNWADRDTRDRLRSVYGS